MILLITGPVDPHVDRVSEKLRGRGVEFLRFDPADFPSAASISLAFQPAGAGRATLRVAGREVDLNSLRAVWYRRPNPPAPAPEIADPKLRNYVAEESQGFVLDVWNSLGCPWTPAQPAAIQRAQLKSSQLQIAASVGFELPPTLITNDFREFLDFHRRHNGRVVSKLIGTAFMHAFGETFNRYTEMVSMRDVGYAQSIRHCPVIFQAYVPKQFELRITVVGRQVFAAEIHSQQSHRAKYDWRRYDASQTPHRPHDLPADVRERCLQLTDTLGLNYGAIDMIVTPDGRYVFLEINPNGQYLWIEEQTGLPISDAICDLLLAEPVSCRGESP